MSGKAIKIVAAAVFFVAFLAVATPSQAQQPRPAILDQVSVTQNLNAQIPPDLVFHDENGKNIRLGDLFGQKPIVLSLVYFNCPGLCMEVLDGELRTMRSVPLDLGKDYEAITVSFEPTDTPAAAKAKRDVYLGQYGRSDAGESWHFLTGNQKSIDALTKAVGFHYVYDSKNKQYAHPAAIMVLTPQGRISRYFYGTVYPARDLQAGLIAASQGKMGSVLDSAIVYCYRYDPFSGKYGMVVMNIIRAGAGLTLLALGSFMFVMFRRDLKVHVEPPVAGAKLR